MSDRDPLAGEWRGEPTWGCPYCAYDSTNESAVREHIQWAHPMEPELTVSRKPAKVTAKEKPTDG